MYGLTTGQNLLNSPSMRQINNALLTSQMHQRSIDAYKPNQNILMCVKDIAMTLLSDIEVPIFNAFKQKGDKIHKNLRQTEQLLLISYCTIFMDGIQRQSRNSHSKCIEQYTVPLDWDTNSFLLDQKVVLFYNNHVSLALN